MKRAEIAAKAANVVKKPKEIEEAPLPVAEPKVADKVETKAIAIVLGETPK